METQLVISTVSEKYGHVSSLGIRASLFIFITTALHHFSLSYYAFCFCYPLVATCSLCSGTVVGGVGGRKEKHGHLFTGCWVTILEGRSRLRPSNLHRLCHFLWLSDTRFCPFFAALMRENTDGDDDDGDDNATVAALIILSRGQWVGPQLFVLPYIDKIYCVFLLSKQLGRDERGIKQIGFRSFST